MFYRNLGEDCPDEPNAEEWGLAARLQPDEADQYGYFGTAVDIACDTIIVGAPGTDVDFETNAGAAYLYERHRDSSNALELNAWGLVTTIAASDFARNDRFGEAVALSCDTAVVGAPNKAVDSTGYCGQAYLFERNYDPEAPGIPLANVWGECKILVSVGGVEDQEYGVSVDIACHLVAVGAPGFPAEPGLWTGAAYLCARNYDPDNSGEPSPDNWGQLTMLIPDDAEDGDHFGEGVALSCDRLDVGAWLQNGGAAYVFARTYDPAAPDLRCRRANGYTRDRQVAFTRASYRRLELDLLHRHHQRRRGRREQYRGHRHPARRRSGLLRAAGTGRRLRGVNTVVWTFASLGPGESMRLSIKGVGRVVFAAPPEESTRGEDLPGNGALKPFLPGNLCTNSFFFASG